MNRLGANSPREILFDPFGFGRCSRQGRGGAALDGCESQLARQLGLPRPPENANNAWAGTTAAHRAFAPRAKKRDEPGQWSGGVQPLDVVFAELAGALLE